MLMRIQEGSLGHTPAVRLAWLFAPGAKMLISHLLLLSNSTWTVTREVNYPTLPPHRDCSRSAIQVHSGESVGPN